MPAEKACSKRELEMQNRLLRKRIADIKEAFDVLDKRWTSNEIEAEEYWCEARSLVKGL